MKGKSNSPESLNNLDEIYRSYENLNTYRVGYGGYEKLEIEEDDYILVRKSTVFYEDRFSVWKLPDKAGLSVGIAYENFDEISISIAAKISRYKRADVQLIGIVVAIIKPFGEIDLEELVKGNI